MHDWSGAQPCVLFVLVSHQDSLETDWLEGRPPPASVIWGEASGWKPNRPSQAVPGTFLFLLTLRALQRKFLQRASSVCKLAPDNGGCKSPSKLSKFLCSSEPSNWKAAWDFRCSHLGKCSWPHSPRSATVGVASTSKWLKHRGGSILPSTPGSPVRFKERTSCPKSERDFSYSQLEKASSPKW